MFDQLKEIIKNKPSLEELKDKIISLFGESNNVGVDHNVPDPTKIGVLFDRYPLSSLLHYEHFNEETRIFHNKKSAGFILEASLLTGANSETENILLSILTDVLPTNADIQFLLWSSNKVGLIFEDFKDKRGTNNIYRFLAEKRVEFLSRGANESLVNNGSYVLRDFQLFIVVSTPRTSNDNAINLLNTRNNIMSSLRSVGIISESMGIDRFLSVMTDILNPTATINPTYQNWNEKESLSLQLTNPETRLKVCSDKLVFETNNENYEEVEVRCFGVKDFPKTMALWRMSENIGQLFNNTLQIPCPFLISLNIRVLDYEKSIARAQFKFMDKDKTARSALAKFKPTMSKEYEDWANIRARLADGDRLVHAFYQVITFSLPAQANLIERKVRDLYRANNWKINKLSYLQLQSFLAMLPMCMSEGMYKDSKDFGRLRTMTAFNAVSIAPLIGEWKGTRTASLILPNRRGQIATWNPFDSNDGNYNIAIAAKSGSGKSVFAQEYILSILGLGGRVWVIDIGRSYEKTCKLLKGEFVEFKPDSHISLNPFTKIKNFDESLVMLKPLIAAMVRPVTRASEEELAFIEKAVKGAWQTHGNEATITTVCNWLNAQEDPRCKNLGHLLHTFSIDGMYGKYFDGACTIDIDNSFVVLELQELSAKKDLQKVVLLALMYQISEAMYLGDRSQYKTLILEEMWQHFTGQDSGMALFVEAGYRTVRKYGGNYVGIGQSINDYFKSESAKVAFENSEYKIIFSQSPETIDDLKKNDRFTMDAYTEKLLKSLRKTDEYSECMIRSSSGDSVHRVLLDPYARILYSSTGKEVEAVNQLQREGLSLEEAIANVANMKLRGEFV